MIRTIVDAVSRALGDRRLRARRLLVTAVLAGAQAQAADLGPARAHLEAGRLDQVEAAVAHIADEDAEAAFLLGRVRFQQREWEDAGDLFEEAVDLGRDTSETHLWLGRAKAQEAQEASLFRRLGIAGDSLDAFKRAVELDPSSPDARMGLINYYTGAPSIAGGDLDLAREHAAVLAELDPWMGVLAQGQILRSDDEDADLLPLYEDAVARMPEHADARFTLGLMYVQAERWDDAESAFQATQEIDGEHRGVLYQWGKFAAVTGRGLERGVEALSRYLETPEDPEDPSFAWAHYRLGMIHEHRSMDAEAESAYRLALSLDEDHEAAEDALRRLARR